ncbi:TIGR01906 family membrane protein [Streptococcus iniae]|uniref:TIGR01906 family membrane protein n=1 Tax=Streptococcus iniae TaxID=1346 RepID=UPI0008D9DCE0|nr:TIGR01906 family membrane protein [Streptococcus iniae]OHX27488.1 hypothetical protein BKX95_04945 [Streptococcus iniae]RLV27952.1 TIGR01906 family membrane protein [Streptococcus iniae]
MRENCRVIGLWLWLLSFAVLATIYLAWLSYPLEIDFLGIDKVVYMTKASILYHFNGLMSYLTNPFHQTLRFASFSSSKAGLSHFQDVKILFHVTQAIFVLLAFPSLKFLKTTIQKQLMPLYQKAFLSAAICPVLIASFAFMIGFEQFFILFHKILFAGKSNWTFDPLTDPVIWILPESFFRHCFIAFFILYELAFWSLYSISKKQENNKKQTT